MTHSAAIYKKTAPIPPAVYTSADINALTSLLELRRLCHSFMYPRLPAFLQVPSTWPHKLLQPSYMQPQRLFKMAAEQVLDGVFGMLRTPIRLK